MKHSGENMLTIKEMCLAHLSNVHKALQDLKNQEAKIKEEIEKLETYLQEGNNLLAENGDSE
jgi:5'-deoxynucleotidase YfbR-like HD superfamily hydrolase